MRKVISGLLLCALLIGAAACAAAPARTAEVASYSGPAPAAVPAPAAAMAEQAKNSAASNTVPNDTARMIVRNVNISLVVTDTEPALKAINEMVASAGGYVADSSAWQDGEQVRARITVRIPAEDLDAILSAIRGLAVRVETENITGQDVTEEFSDLDAQLVNLEAAENELRELLGEVRQTAQKAEDILAIYRELTNIRGEIERVKGRMQYLSTLTAMATLSIELIPDILAKPVVEPGWRPQETLKNATRALVKGLQGIANGAIWLVLYVIPILLIIAIPFVLLILLIRWLVRRGRARRAG